MSAPDRSARWGSDALHLFEGSRIVGMYVPAEKRDGQLFVRHVPDDIQAILPAAITAWEVRGEIVAPFVAFEDAVAARADYLDLFERESDAIEYEQRALSIGDEHLPEVARRVRDGKDDEPGAEYWRWLISQVQS